MRRSAKVVLIQAEHGTTHRFVKATTRPRMVTPVALVILIVVCAVSTNYSSSCNLNTVATRKLWGKVDRWLLVLPVRIAEPTNGTKKKHRRKKEFQMSAVPPPW